MFGEPVVNNQEVQLPAIRQHQRRNLTYLYHVT